MTTVLLQTVTDEAISWPEAIVAVAGVAMVTVIVTIAIQQVLASLRARMSIAREQAYRKLAEESTAAATRLAGEQEQISQSLKAITDRLSGIEKVLREVG
jgi:hypothetical protein